MKRFIFICSNFPPLTSGATPVILNLSTYMPLSGWEMLPLTLKRPRGLPADSTLEKSLPAGLSVTRVTNPDPAALFRRTRLDGARRADSEAQSSSPSGLMNTLFIPDRLVAWMPFVVPAGIRKAHREGASAVVSFGPHHSLHLHGRLIARFAGIPHVPFFGDLWVKDSYVSWPSAFHRAAASVLERFIVTRADGIAATTVGSVEYFRKTYGKGCPAAQVVENGYDPAIELPAPPVGRGSRMIVTYTGNFFGTNSPEFLVRGLRMFLESNPEAPLLVRFVGNSQCPSLRGGFAEGLSGHLELTGTVPFQKVPEVQMASDVLLAVLSDLPGSELKTPSKLAEYLRTGKPIIALAPEGDLTAHIRRFNAGWVHPPTAEGFAAALSTALEAWKSGSLARAVDLADVAGTFDARNITKRFAAFLDEVSACRGKRKAHRAKDGGRDADR